MTITLTKDPTGQPAVNLNKLRAQHPGLVKRAEKAGISLSKRGLDGVRAQAVMLLDHSGSMHHDYRAGTVQTLVERALGFALQVDVDGAIPVIPFDDKLHLTGTLRRRPHEVNVGNYQDIVNQQLWKPNAMGGTLMAPPLQYVANMARDTDAPIFLIVIGDGSPQDRSATTNTVIELAKLPVFIKFLAIRPVDYLQTLDDLPPSRRLIDNVDAKFIADPAGMSDLAFADAMTDEWNTWIAAASTAGVLA